MLEGLVAPVTAVTEAATAPDTPVMAATLMVAMAATIVAATAIMFIDHNTPTECQDLNKHTIT